MESYQFYPQIAVIGKSIESWNSALFPKANLYFSLLHDWIGKSRIDQKITEERIHQIQIKPKPATIFKVNDEATLALNSEVRTSSRSGLFEIEERHSISVEFPKPVCAKKIFSDYAPILRRLLSFLIGTEVVLESVDFEIPNKDTSPDRIPLLQRNEASVRAKHEIRTERMIVPFSEISTFFPDVVTKWFDYHARLDAVMNLYFAVIFNPNLYINHQFLFLAQALEVYHRSNSSFVGYVEPKSVFRSRRDKIIALAPDEEKEWLKEKLCHANQKTLAERLDDILSSNRLEAEKLIDNIPRFAEAIRHTRNYHTHFEKEAKESNKVIHDIKEMVKIVSQMEALLGICILKDLGITGAPIDRLISRHKSMKVFSLE